MGQLVTPTQEPEPTSQADEPLGFLKLKKNRSNERLQSSSSPKVLTRKDSHKSESLFSKPNVLTIYNEQSFDMFRVRVNPIMTLG